MTELPIKQLNKYYELVLVLPSPALLPRNKLDKYYKEILDEVQKALKDGRPLAALALADRPNAPPKTPPALADLVPQIGSESESDEDVLVGSPSPAGPQSQQEEPEEDVPHPESPPERPERSDSDDVFISGPQPVKPVPERPVPDIPVPEPVEPPDQPDVPSDSDAELVEGPVPMPVEPPVEPDVSSSSDSDAELVVDPADTAVSYPSHILGRRLKLDVHKEHEPAGYRRLIVTCRYKGHQRCKKHRNLGFEQTAIYGDQEPVGFLACWLQGACNYTNAADHIAYEPTLAEVGRWMRSNAP